ncbi:protein of unknown function [Streptantibioticus cattleyicolor NRRL 8057 = DSM 46488]|nr:protein of unknown function [Streptantibioticus cattleyicolor NRRL 8057 = DSM 46488]
MVTPDTPHAALPVRQGGPLQGLLGRGSHAGLAPRDPPAPAATLDGQPSADVGTTA